MSRGWLHPDGRRILALRYGLEAPPPTSSEIVVWLREDGHAELRNVRRSDRRPIVYTRRGEVLLINGVVRRVVSVRVFVGDDVGQAVLFRPQPFS